MAHGGRPSNILDVRADSSCREGGPPASAFSPCPAFLPGSGMPRSLSCGLKAWVTGITLLVADPASAAEARKAADPAQVVSLAVYPPAVELNGKDARQQVVLTARLGNGHWPDVTRQASYRRAGPGVAG